jgi:hypothetical protein
LFELLPEGFCNADPRIKVADLLNQDPFIYSPGRMAYDLRWLRLIGLIEQQPHSDNFVTQNGIRIILFLPEPKRAFLTSHWFSSNP